MLKLIRLEWKKNNVGKYIRNVVIMSALICMFIFALCYLGIANDPDTGVPDAAPGNSAISSSIELFTSMAFLVFTSVMLSTYIVSAYKNKTMNLMFSYPIKRQKILISQMLAVWIFNFVALVLTKLLIYGCILLGSQFMVSSFPLDYNMASISRISIPPTKTAPASTSQNRAISLAKVDLPEPEGPTKAVTLPAFAVKEIP